MKLTFEQIKEITVGAVRLEEREDGIHFFKCTEKQISCFEHASHFFGEGSKGTTGIHLDFHTDATKITVSVNGGGKYEVYVNGVFFEQYIYREPASFEVNLPASDTLNRVMISLPSHGSGGVIREIVLNDATRVQRHPYDCKMLFLGDSITQGWNSQYDTLSYAYRTAAFFNAEALNQGIGGSRFLPETVVPLPFDPDYVFIAYGTNDFDHYKHNEDPIEDFRRVMSEYLDRIKVLYPGRTVFVLSPIPRLIHDEAMLALFRELCKAVREEAVAKGFVAINGDTLFPLCVPLLADGKLHPNDNGFSVYAENLIRQILPYVKH